MSITVSGVSKSYGKQKALDKVSFTLNKGEICGFLGPNGAGKSTMMKIITGYLKEYEGKVYLGNTDIRKCPLEAKAMVGYLPEHNPLYTEMYIPEYLSYVARLYRVPQVQERVKEMMETIGLLPEKNKKIGQLSKGYRQRVGLAQALIHDPEILILDEPMTGLDPNQLEEIRGLIIRIGQNKTVMLSTHVMQEVEAICNRIIIINHGNIITDKYKTDLQASASGMLLEVGFATPVSTDWLKEIENIVSVQPLGNNRYRLKASGTTDPRIALFQAAAAHHCPIIELKTEGRELEEIFRELTAK